MCVRTAIGSSSSSNIENANSYQRHDAISISQFDEFCIDWANRWCVTPEGRSYWRKCAWEAMFLFVTPETRAKFKDMNIGLHIQLCDFVSEHGIRENISECIRKVLGMHVNCI